MERYPKPHGGLTPWSQFTPSPSGKVFSQEELEFIAGVCKKHDVLVISDEVSSQNKETKNMSKALK